MNEIDRTCRLDRRYKALAWHLACVICVLLVLPFRANGAPSGDALSTLSQESTFKEFNKLCLKLALQARENRDPQFKGEAEALQAFQHVLQMMRAISDLLTSQNELHPDERKDLQNNLQQCKGALIQAGFTP